MKRALLCGISVIAGILCANLFCASVQCRNALSELLGRGKLIALVRGAGIYERDLKSGSEKSRLIAQAVIDFLARNEKVDRTAIDADYARLKFQLRDEKTWKNALRANHLCAAGLRKMVARNLRDERWLEQQIEKEIAVSSEEGRAHFEAKRGDFVQPVRFRASHFFLAAPPETPDAIVDLKRRTMEELSKRVKGGEKFSDLAASFSEDEATKKFGGDLKYFSELRMPTDFMEAVKKIRLGATSDVVRTKLGFHLIQVTDLKAARPMTFEEANSEIVLQLENVKRRVALEKLVAKLSRQAEFVR